ncbi:hypothetical protein BSL78_28263 [Apostichopus japonicus]|uniref:C2H2-type domain-containing protein n=1 Tax=Stichopus japonicus TaxID=307972 RepID=A0A2G8JGQ0_STIJA|nr:hypothetical protein BSL78_28263 [Apostichopus japonicus]
MTSGLLCCLRQAPHTGEQVHHLPVPQPRGQPPSHHAMLQDSRKEMYRERERHLDFSSGKRVLIDDDNLYVSPAPTYQRNLISREKSMSIEMERQERERQRQADLQRRAELQRELEMERENLRIQKEEEERELERQRKRESERQREAERQRELEQQREMERKREVERKRQREIERERERERQRQAEEEEDRKRQMEQERERLRLQLEREQREREIQRQQEMIREREMKIQQEYEENEQRMQFERGQRAAMDCDQETFHHMREMDMLREREAALEQEMAFRDQRRPPPRQDIPSLLTMPKVAPSATMKKGLLGDINDGLDDALMEKVKLQQAMLAQQTTGNTNQKPNQNRLGRNRRSQRKRVNQQMREGNRNANKGSNNSQNQRQNRQKQNNKKQSGKARQKGQYPSKTTDGSKPDLYDPLHPTDDEENVQDLKRKHSDGELQIPSSGGIQPTKEMLYQMRPKMSASLEWICHVCNVKCHEVMNYHQHMMGKRHQAMMSHITEVAEAKTDEAFKTLRAEGHVDRIRRGFESHRPSSKNVQQTYFCDVCTTYIFCDREAHNRSEEHQTALKVMERRCKVCNKSFKSLSAFMNHCNTINHRMSFEVQQEKGKIEATKIVEESKKLKKRRDKVFVTVDEVGYEPDDNKILKHLAVRDTLQAILTIFLCDLYSTTTFALAMSPEFVSPTRYHGRCLFMENCFHLFKGCLTHFKALFIFRLFKKTSSDDGTLPDSKQETKSKPEVVTLKGSSAQSQPIVAVLSADPVPSVQSKPKDLATPDILNPTPSSQLSLPSFDNVLEEMKKDPEPWSMQDLVSYNPNSIVGRYRKEEKRKKKVFLPFQLFSLHQRSWSETLVKPVLVHKEKI